MKLGLISQIKNEIDIIETFINHVDSLFDQVYFIDHQSLDGTEKVMKDAVSQRPGWKYFYLDVKTKVQAEVSNLLIPQIFADGVDYLFFLDSDEIIDVDSRGELEKRLQNWTDKSTVGILNWKNCICDDLKESQFSDKSRFWIPGNESHFQKIIIPKELFENNGKRIVVSQGNHNAFDSQGKRIDGTKIGNLIHIPIRSLQQAQQKTILAVITYKGFSYQIPGDNFQYYEMLEKIANGKISDDDVRGFTIGFEKPGIENSAVSKEELLKRGYTLTSLANRSVARRSDLRLQTVKNEIPFSLIVALTLNNLEKELPIGVPLKLMGNSIVIDEQAMNNFFESQYEDEASPEIEFEFAGQDLENAALNKQIQELNLSAAKLRGIAKNQEKVIKSLGAQVAMLTEENKLLNLENVMYVNSQSWQLTRPLRKIKKLLGG